MIDYLEYDRLLLHRNRLTDAERGRLESLDLEDERLGDRIAPWLPPAIVGGWLALLLLVGGLMP